MNRLILILTLLAGMVSGAEREQEVLGRLKLKKGQSFSFLIFKRQQRKRPGSDEIVIIGQGQRLTVTDANDKGYVVRIDFTAAYFNLASRNRNVVYNSTTTRKPAPLDAMFVSGPVGEHVVVDLSPTGKITRVQRTDKIIAQGAKRLKQSGAVEETKMMAKDSAWQQIFGADAIKHSLEDLLSYLPRKEVAVDATWTSESQIVDSYRLQANSEWTVKKVEQDCFHLAQDAKLKTHADNAPLHYRWGEEQAQFDISFEHKLTGTRTGTHIIDSATNLPRLLHTKSDLSGDLNLSFGNRPSVQKTSIREEEVVFDEAFREKLQLPEWAKIEFTLPKPLGPEEEAKVKELIRQLGANSFKVRGNARRQLQKYGPEILPLLEAERDSEEPEVRGSVKALIERLEN